MIIQAFTKHGSLIEEIIIDAEDDEDTYLEIEDPLGRKWKLTPVTNPDIRMPFIIKPIYQDQKP